MAELLGRWMEKWENLVGDQPILALALGGALLAVFFVTAWREDERVRNSVGEKIWAILGHGRRIVWAAILIGLVLVAMTILRNYLNGALADFRGTHGRVSEANYNAVQNIWGPETDQGELTVEFGYDEEVTERVEFDDPEKPALIKKKIVHRTVPVNPFESAQHEVMLKRSDRKKGSAVYPGYETECRFRYALNYSGERDVKATLRFPLPSQSAVYNDLAVNLNGESVLGAMQIRDGALVLEQDVQKGWSADVEVAFKSRGVAFWYFQVKESRVIRDFELTLRLPDLPEKEVNYPEGCMTPTDKKPTADGKGCVLSYKLGNAVSSKGMGIALSKPPQPGETTNRVLSATGTAWSLLFVALLLGLSLANVQRAILVSVLVGAAAAFGYGLLGSFHDVLFGFWGSAAVILIPLFALLSWLLTRVARGSGGKLLAVEGVLFGVLLPSLMGLDHERETLYLNVAAFIFLAVAAWQLFARFKSE